MPDPRLVLVVDDEETDRTAILNSLESEGFRVVATENYEKALAAGLRSKGIFFLVADVALPDGNGCALAIALRQRIPDLQVLFVSGHVGSEACRYYGLDVGDTHFLRKPFEAEDLVARVKALIHSREPFPRLYMKPSSAGC